MTSIPAPGGAGASASATRSLVFGLTGNLVLRAATNATGVMLGLYLARIDATMYPISAFEVGLFSVVFYLSELALAPYFGALSDRYGRKLFAILGGLFGLVAVMLTGLTNVLAVLLVTRLLEGLSAAASVPAVLGILSAETGDNEARRGRSMAFFEVATIFGIGLGVFAGGQLWERTRTAAWLAIPDNSPEGATSLVGFFFIAAIYLAAIGLFALMPGRHASRAAGAHPSLWQQLQVLRNPKILHFAPAWLAVNAVVGLWFGHGVFQLARSGELTQFLSNLRGDVVGTALLGFAIAFIAGCLAWGYVFGRVSRSTMLLISLGGVFIATGFLFLLNSFGHLGPIVVIPLTVLLFLAVMVEAGFTPASLAYLAEIAEEYGEDRGTIMGFYSVFLGGGQLVGGVLGAPFAQFGGVNGLLLCTVLIGAVAFGTVLALRNEIKRQAELAKTLRTAH